MPSIGEERFELTQGVLGRCAPRSQDRNGLVHAPSERHRPDEDLHDPSRVVGPWLLHLEHGLLQLARLSKPAEREANQQ
eukprot:7255426-Prymnesium_polylepis.1